MSQLEKLRRTNKSSVVILLWGLNLLIAGTIFLPSFMVVAQQPAFM